MLPTRALRLAITAGLSLHAESGRVIGRSYWRVNRQSVLSLCRRGGQSLVGPLAICQHQADSNLVPKQLRACSALTKGCHRMCAPRRTDLDAPLAFDALIRSGAKA